MFLTILVIGISSVVIQGILAYFDQRLTGRQMRSIGVIDGYSFIEHGGMWADIFVISPLVAYLVSKYRFETMSWYGILVATLSVIATLAMLEQARKATLRTPEAHAHDGKTTLVGWIHAVYMLIGMWVISMFLLSPTNPCASHFDLIAVAVILTPFFWLGVKKFNYRWQRSLVDTVQIIVGPTVIWSITLIRLILDK